MSTLPTLGGLERFTDKVAFIWSVADLLRGDYKASEYGKVILPLVVIRRLDCVLEPTKEKVLAEHTKLTIKNVESVLRKASGQAFFNTSKLDFRRLLDDPAHIARNLKSYINAFSENAADVLANFSFSEEIARLDRANILYLVIGKFAEIDLHPNVVSNIEMGYIFEELIRRFSEQSNETAGEHFTPREVIALMAELLFAPDRERLRVAGTVRTLYDPACGTGGMLSVAGDALRELNPDARLEVFGQELNPESYAVCKADMMLKGQDPAHVHLGNSFTQDGEPNSRFDYMLSNPPFGVDWKKVAESIRNEHATLGHNGRFGAGLPRITDGALLFLQHMLAKMQTTNKGGSRIAIVFNGSPLFTGGADSGESNIRQWIIERDFLEAIVALPPELFYNTGISTYLWIMSNRKGGERRGKVQLIDAREQYKKMRKSLGSKRNELAREHIRAVVALFDEFAESSCSMVVPNEALGYYLITVDRPLRLVGTDPNREYTPKEIKSFREVGTRDETAAPIIRKVHKPGSGVKADPLHGCFDATVGGHHCVVEYEPDPDLRDTEQVPLLELGGLDAFFRREVLPHAADAWYAADNIKVGYEIGFVRYFYRPRPMRPLADIRADILALEKQGEGLLRQVVGDGGQ